MPDPLFHMPDWSDFERDYVATGVPHKFVVRASPGVSLFVDKAGSRLGAHFEKVGPPVAVQPSSFAEIHTSDVVIVGNPHIEISTEASPLFANFYRLVLEVVSDVVDNDVDPSVALAAAVDRWEALLSRPRIMSDQSQTGMFGELLLLEQLVRSEGASAIDTWVGPTKEAHDFRWANSEFEVKTTTGTRRVHRVNGLEQLQPSVGCNLYLLSLKLTDAGTGGRSLPELVADIELAIGEAPVAFKRFQAGLKELGYFADDGHLYPRRRRLRDAAMLLPIQDGVPRLTREGLKQIDERFATTLISAVQYSIDIEGLGFYEGTEAFAKILPHIDLTGAQNV